MRIMLSTTILVVITFLYTSTAMANWDAKCKYYQYDSELLICTAYLEDSSKEMYLSLGPNIDGSAVAFYLETPDKLARDYDLSTLSVRVDANAPIDLSSQSRKNGLDNSISFMFDRDVLLALTEQMEQGSMLRLNTAVSGHPQDAYFEFTLAGFEKAWSTVMSKTLKDW